MTSNPDRVVEIMISAACPEGDKCCRQPYECLEGWDFGPVVKRQIAALEAAGLRVLPKKATVEMLTPASSAHLGATWVELAERFDPTTYTPEESDDQG